MFEKIMRGSVRNFVVVVRDYVIEKKKTVSSQRGGDLGERWYHRRGAGETILGMGGQAGARFGRPVTINTINFH